MTDLAGGNGSYACQILQTRNTVMWYLQSKTDHSLRITCKSHDDALYQYYRQWRDDDGSIPWEICYDE